MSRCIYVILGLLFCTNIAHSQEYYYWANGKKHPLEIYADKQYVLTKNVHPDLVAQDLSIPKQAISKLQRLTVSKTVVGIHSSRAMDDGMYWGIVNQAIQKDRLKSVEVLYAAPFFLCRGKEVGLSQFFYIKLRQKKDVEFLVAFAKQNKVEVVGHDRFMPMWYILSCDKNSKGNSLEMANLFYETNRFAYAEPDFMVNYGTTCTNDPHFNNQWHLNNTGQFGGTAGNDTRACEAWGITRGCADVVVAVLDTGLEFNHPDLTNISTTSFDTHLGTTPSYVRGNHGVAVAGIIGAAADNNLGVAGIAPNVQLMSISDDLQYAPLIGQRLASGINFAWQNGADVINNSWSGNTLPQQQLISDAIDDAVTQGRNGLGTVVVFATGNDNNNGINFPSSHPDVIAVGATSICNERKSPSSCDGENWGSNYGTGIDVVAPGVLISTTDRQGNYGYNPNIPIHLLNDGSLVSNDYTDKDFTTWFNGTSAAAPQVSGIAALILSVNPTLTQQQVRHIIESTTDRIGSYTYTLGAGEQTGLKWNNQMGYGRVNALKAVQAVVNTYTITGPAQICTDGAEFTFNNPPTGATVTWTASPGNLFDESSGSGATAELAPKGSKSKGSGTLTFFIHTNCGDTIQVQKTLWVGGENFTASYNNGQPIVSMPYPTPLLPVGDPGTVITYNPVCADAEAYVIIGGNNGTWEKISPLTYIWWGVITNNDLFFTLPTSGSTARFRLTWDDGCGNTRMEDFYFEATNCTRSLMTTKPCLKFLVSPNPARSIVTIEVSTNHSFCDNAELATEKHGTLTIESVSLVDIFDGQEKYAQTFSGQTRKAILDITTLKKGMYILRISGGKQLEDHRIIIE